MRLLLARHARTASNVAAVLDTAPPGPELDDVGHAQAAGLAERVAGQRIGAVYSSDMTRAVQTAAPSSQALAVPHLVLPDLREIAAGADEMSAELDRYQSALWAWGRGRHDVRIRGGEDGFEFMARFDRAFRAVADAGHDVVLVVSHGAAIRTWSGFQMPGVHVELRGRSMPNTAVIIADGDPDSGWTLRGFDYPEPDPDDGFASRDYTSSGPPAGQIPPELASD